jgi:DNA-binding response OmpR family regulator
MADDWLAVPQLGGTETVLVVIGDALLRHRVAEALRRGGYAVLEAPGEADAGILAQHRSGAIHLLLVDEETPGLSLVRLFRALRPRHPALRVLCLDDLASPLTVDILSRALRDLLDAG